MAFAAEPSAPAPGLLRRFQYSLGANAVRGVLSFGNGILIARAVGAAAYGNLTFLVASFTAIFTLADMGTGSAFFSFLSARPRGRRFFALYGVLLAGQFAATAAVVLLLPQAWFHTVWVGQHRGLVLLAFLASFLSTQVWNAFIWLGEALRRTGFVQSLNVARAAVHFLFLLAAFALGRLTIELVFWLLAAEYAAFAVFFTHGLVRASLAETAEAGAAYRTLAAEFWHYCRPLALYVWVCFIYTFADRWLLQRFGGSVQQGYFAIGQQFSVIALLVTRSSLNVFWKEVAAAKQAGDHARLERIYHGVNRGLYWAAAFVCAAVVPYSRDILRLTLGSGFTSGAACLSLMFLYPVHQSLGQIQGAFFYATGDTLRQTFLGVLTMALSLPTAYFLLASRNELVPGLGMGALGLAFKMVGVQIVVINIQAWMINRRHGWRQRPAFQLVLPVLIGLAFLCRSAAVWLAAAARITAPPVVAGGGVVVYALAAILLTLGVPGLAGFRRGELVALWRRLVPGADGMAA